MSIEASFPTNDNSSENTVKTFDGYVNFVSKLGLGAQNNLSASYYIFNYFTRNKIQLEAAYRGSWLVGQVIDTVADDMTRAGITITTNEAAENIKKIEKSFKRLKIWQSINQLIKWSRLYGGAIAVMQIEGHNLADPLDITTISKGQFKGLGVYDRWQLDPDLVNLINVGADLGLPAYYNIVLGRKLPDDPVSASTGQIKVHHSRCIRMIGIDLPYWQAITEMMWGESVLERMLDRLISFDSTTMSTANLVDRASLRTVKIKRLRDIISSGGQALQGLMAMFDMVRRFQDNEGLTLLDLEDEFQTNQYAFSGLADILLQFGQQVAGASGIPLVRLFGQSPAGLNATGDADIRMYYDNINKEQESRLSNPMEILLKIIYRSTFGLDVPEDLDFTFTSLWQMSAKDKSEIAKVNTETIVAAYQNALIDAPTAMLELRDTQSEYGLFGNITDEMIQEAINNPPIPNEYDPEGESDKPEVKNIDSNINEEELHF